MGTPIFTSAIVAARAAAKRTRKERRVLARAHGIGLWAWVARFLRIRGRSRSAGK